MHARSITTGKPNSAAMDGEINTKTTVHFNSIRIKSEPNVYEMSTERSLTEAESSEPDNQSSHESGDYKFDVEFHHTAKSFANVNVQLKEEPNACDIRSSYSSNETETRDQLIDNQSCNSGDKDKHVRMATSCLDRYGTNYAVCIKFEPNSCEVKNSCMKSESDVDIGKTYHIDGSPDNSHCYKNDSHDSHDILNRDVQHTCRPIESEIHESNLKETNTEHSVPCDNIYKSDELARHKDKRRKITYTCDICRYSTAWPDHFLEHKRKHTQEYPYICDVCSYSAAKSSHLDAHKRKHTEKPYKCEKCSYRTDMSDRLEAHKRKHTEKPYKCNMCSFRAYWPSVLARHTRKHTEKPYKCDVCSYSTAWSSHSEAHKRKHAEEISYKCDVCSYSSKWPSDLARHKLKHTGEKPYKCDVCSYSSKWSSDLARHKRTQCHKDKKPFKCSYTTVSSRTLNKHEIKHKEEERSLTSATSHTEEKRSLTSATSHTEEERSLTSATSLAREERSRTSATSHTGEERFRTSATSHTGEERSRTDTTSHTGEERSRTSATSHTGKERSRTSATSHTEEERSRISVTSRRLRTILPKPQNFDSEKIDITVRSIPVLYHL